MIKSIIMGIFQGLTEFLPVSSSGHLVVLKNILHFDETGITLEVFLHFGTLVSIIVFFNKKILNYIKPKNLFFIVIGTIPAGLIGFLFKDQIEKAFSSIFFVIPAFFLTGIYLFIAEKKHRENKKEINLLNALMIGIAQAFALLPGISRSGWTTSTGLLSGLSRSLSFEFSFILSIPALLGAFILVFKDINSFSNLLPVLIGTVFSFFTGLITLFIFSKMVILKKLRYFAYYLWFISFLLLSLLALGIIH